MGAFFASQVNAPATRRRRRPTRLAVGVSLAIAVVAGACSSSSKSAPPTTASSATASTATGATTATTAAASSEPTPGVTSTSIKISVLAQFSGGAAAQIISSWYDSGVVLWADMVNKAGGIHGRQIQLVKIDHMDTPEGGVAACKQVESNGSFAAMVVEGVNGHIPAIQCLDQAGIPVLFNYPDPRLTSKLKTAFSVAAPFDDEKGQVLVNFIKNYLQKGSAKIGVLYRSDSPVYAAAGSDFASTAKSSGLNVVDVETVTSTQTSPTAQLVHLKNAGAEVVFIAGDIELFSVLPAAKAIGFAPQWVGTPGWAGNSFTNVLGAAMQGIKMVSALPGNNSPAYADYAAKATADGKKPDRDALYFYTYALVMGQALDKAGQDLTRPGWVKAMESISSYDPQTGAPVSFSATKHDGTDALFPVQCCDANKDWESLGPASTFSS
ncbi:MAG TPA: ABC transporter substrate-binding protein [Acidimicrobiales bacterium]|nr:ABC transporter substrate-binding protein [Acidimicrobiales bacterium]